jgi:hypothetical protein
LRCGERVLSEADNWYVPARLTTEMNRLLDTTETPFGRAVQRLAPYRRTLEVRMLWAPLPEGWERQPRQAAAAASVPLAIPDALFEHRAVLYTRDHTPFSEVHEVYQRDLLAFLFLGADQKRGDAHGARDAELQDTAAADAVDGGTIDHVGMNMGAGASTCYDSRRPGNFPRVLFARCGA